MTDSEQVLMNALRPIVQTIIGELRQDLLTEMRANFDEELKEKLEELKNELETETESTIENQIGDLDLSGLVVEVLKGGTFSFEA